ncbi:hypothetical protein BH23ACT8_BH23ACT8_15740 [soil metagenome]
MEHERAGGCERCDTRDVEAMAAEFEDYLAAAADGWDWVAEDGPAGPAWHVAWALVGLPDPLPRERYGEVLGAVEARHGIGAVIAGLRLAASMPAPHGSAVTPARFAALATSFDRRRRASS